ncbi:HAD ATPase, P-type, IC family protein [Mycobacterium xenopi 3993]|nr:HAD ATPase, P-type, IC family protein [Mycobacterium xenopi 3993]
MQARLRELTSKVLPLTLAGGAAVTGLALLRRASLRQAVADGIAIAVAAVPEGLPLVASVAQLAAARRLSRRGVLVRAPRTIEALGRVETVCFDKTGTLTENRLHVVCAVPATTDPTRAFPDLADPQAAEVLLAAARLVRSRRISTDTRMPPTKRSSPQPVRLAAKLIRSGR